jgi:diaminopimelate decarboxylase
MPRRSASGEPLRVGIVGVGPKGLYGFERLVAHARAAQRPVAIDLFEPTGELGAGAVYSRRQPSCLSMNFADEMIDAWPPAEEGSRRREGMSYTAWLRSNDVGSRQDGYSPRSRVGNYLADSFETVLRSVPRNVEVSVRVGHVESVESEPGGGWCLTSTDGDGSWSRARCDEVLLAVGHNRVESFPGAITPSSPAGNGLGAGVVPPGSDVRVRGMALTAIDAALLLTEGRGGRFVVDVRPGRLRYVPSGSEPGCITLGSRTGRLLSVKPDPARYRSSAGVAAARRRGAERLRGGAGMEIDAELIPALGRTAAELLAALGAVEPDRVAEAGARCASALRTRLRAGFEAPEQARRALAVSLANAIGARPPDAPWALGEAWRALYPVIVERGSHGGIGDEEWPAFAALAREMERLAFGPPPVVAAKLLALFDSGILALADRPFGEDAANGAGPLVNAVLARPGPSADAGSPIGGLMAGGHLRRASGGRRGIEVDESAACVGRTGQPTPGLSAVGRLTEDWVIGNDTLSRRLHAYPDRWARRVVGAR